MSYKITILYKVTVHVAVAAGICDVLDTLPFKHTKFIVSTSPSCPVLPQLLVVAESYCGGKENLEDIFTLLLHVGTRFQVSCFPTYVILFWGQGKDDLTANTCGNPLGKSPN